ncbi:MAG: hypothetical protein APR54_07965 [Candidatus Cloacimonas sp. SDB]|nr:MAG: hypothetical protein APR54_07965 [Candidatus Cloacimonas sp. SDB]
MLKPPNPLRKEFFKHIGLIGSLGFSVIISIILSLIVFKYLDNLFHANNNLLIVGIVFGVFLGMMSAHRQLRRYYKKTDDFDNEK